MTKCHSELNQAQMQLGETNTDFPWALGEWHGPLHKRITLPGKLL